MPSAKVSAVSLHDSTIKIRQNNKPKQQGPSLKLQFKKTPRSFSRLFWPISRAQTGSSTARCAMRSPRSLMDSDPALQGPNAGSSSHFQSGSGGGFSPCLGGWYGKLCAARDRNVAITDLSWNVNNYISGNTCYIILTFAVVHVLSLSPCLGHANTIDLEPRLMS